MTSSAKTNHDPRPKISAIIPCYNSEKTALDAVNSVLNQTRRDLELIAVDDGSADGTAAIIESVNDTRVRLIRQENRGASAARNTGIAAARGDYVAFLDHDDVWFPAFLEKTAALLDGDPRAVMATANQYWQQSPDAPSDTLTLHDCVKFDNSRGEISFEELIKRNVISTSACMARRETLLSCGCFDEELRVAEDYNLWLKIAATHGKILVIAEPLGLSRRFVVGSLVKDKLLMWRDGLLCLDKFYKSHGRLLNSVELKAFKRMRRRNWQGLVYRTLLLKLRPAPVIRKSV